MRHMFYRLNRMMSVAWLLLWLPLGAWAQSTNPYSVVENVSAQLFERLKTEHAQIMADPERLRAILEQDMLPSVDHNYAAYKVMSKAMGRQLKSKTSAEQRKAFVSEFRDYLVSTYARLFTLYDKDRHSYQLAPRRPVQDKKLVTVRVLLMETGKPDIPVDFKMRKNSKTGQWKAYDMVAEGISMLDSKGTELSGLIRKQGIDTVTADLQVKNRQPITLEETR